MFHIPSFQSVREIGLFLSGSGYTGKRLTKDLGLSDTLHASRDNLPVLLSKTAGDGSLSVLARLFFVAWPTDINLCRGVIPEAILNHCIEAGLLTLEDSQFESVAALIPLENLVVACDGPRLRGADANVIVGPSATTRLISRMTVRGSAESTLDLGSGSGVLALEAASYSARVIGTDINERAVLFGRFNAALNGIANASFVFGDAFGPVNEQRFSRIVANPPFFITPAKRFTYSDSPLELDGFTKRVAMEAPAYLEDGGFFQMICEWVQVEGESWEQRLRKWTQSSGCDVLVLRGPQLTPIEYIDTRLDEAKRLHSRQSDGAFDEHLGYLRNRKVEAIVGGVITMRKRSGANWFSIVIGDPASWYAGDAVRERFETMTLAAHTPKDLLKAKFRLASDVVLEERKVLRPESWEMISSELTKTAGFGDRLGLDPIVSQFIDLFNGQHTIGEIANAVSESLHVSSDEARVQCLRFARRLLQNSFIGPG